MGGGGSDDQARREYNTFMNSDLGSMKQVKFGFNQSEKIPADSFFEAAHEQALLVNPGTTESFMFNPSELGHVNASNIDVKQLMFLYREPNKSINTIYDLATVLFRLRTSYELRYMHYVLGTIKADKLIPETDPFYSLEKFREKVVFLGVAYGRPAPSGQEGPWTGNNLTSRFTAVPVTIVIEGSCIFPHVLRVKDFITDGMSIYMMFRLVHKDDARPYTSLDGSIMSSALASQNEDGKYGIPDVVFLTAPPNRVNVPIIDVKRTYDKSQIQTEPECRTYREWDVSTDLVKANLLLNERHPKDKSTNAIPDISVIADPKFTVPLGSIWYKDPLFYEEKDAVVYKVGVTQFSNPNKPDNFHVRDPITSRKILECTPIQVALDIHLLD